MNLVMVQRQRDGGFTLPEVLITVVTIGIISTVLAGIASVVLRNTPDAEARADDARSMLGLVTWLPQDVDSTPPNGFDTDPNSDSDCGVDRPGSVSLLHMQWTERLGATTTTFLANYRHVPIDGAFRLQRITCSGTGSLPFSNRSTQNLTSGLPALPPGWSPGQPPLKVQVFPKVEANPAATPPIPGNPASVTFEITTLDGAVVRTDSAAKNPAETLPTTTMPSWYIPTPTTGVYSNTNPTTTSLSFDAHPVVATMVNLIVNDADGDSLVVELDNTTLPTGWSVVLTGLKLSFNPPGTDLNQTRIITYTVDDLQGGPKTIGTVTVKVVPTTTPTTVQATTSTSTSTTTTTTIPFCAVTGRSLSRTSVRNVQPDGSGGNVNVGVLQRDIIISATTSGNCSGFLVQYASGGTNTPGFVNMSPTGPNSWTGKLPGRESGSSETWSDGGHSISFHSSLGATGTSITLTVT